MCGIFAYISKKQKNLSSKLILGLKALEYRGYDSAGIAVKQDGQITIIKAKGKVSVLEEKLKNFDLQKSNYGIAHTRWATHGEPSEENAHPHLSSNGRLALVHNGIIENYKELKDFLIKKGYSFNSETDSEVLANLIEDEFISLENNGDIETYQKSIVNALAKVRGTYGLVIMFLSNNDSIYVVRKSSPIVLGLLEDEYIIASDYSAIIEHTKNVAYLEEGTLGIVSAKNGISVVDINTGQENPELRQETLELDGFSAGKEGYDHYMLKEINEQPEAIRNTMRGRLVDSTVKLGGVFDFIPRINASRKIYLVASGTSRHAGLIGKSFLEELAGIDVEVEFSSEFSHLVTKLGYPDTVIGISQSGETADTLSALRASRNKKSLILGITNVVGSSLSRETDGGVYIHVGPEISVASTKAFTGQVIILLILALFLKQESSIHSRYRAKSVAKLVNDLHHFPDLLDEVLKKSDSKIKQIAEKIKDSKSVLFFGKGVNHSIALEGALKLKELSYIHAEAMPSGELKHGTIAMIDSSVPCIFVATNYVKSDENYSKIISNIQEVKARGGRIFILATEGDEEVLELGEEVIYLPRVNKYLSPIVNIIPLQLLAYYVAVMLGKNVDQPRNLAKSVTVE